MSLADELLDLPFETGCALVRALEAERAGAGEMLRRCRYDVRNRTTDDLVIDLLDRIDAKGKP